MKKHTKTRDPLQLVSIFFLSFLQLYIPYVNALLSPIKRPENSKEQKIPTTQIPNFPPSLQAVNSTTTNSDNMQNSCNNHIAHLERKRDTKTKEEKSTSSLSPKEAMLQSSKESFISCCSNTNPSNRKPPLSLSPCFHNLKRCIFDVLCLFPTSVLALLLLLLLLSYNALILFSVNVDVFFSDARPLSFSGEKQGNSPVQMAPGSSSPKSPSGVMYTVKEDNLPNVSKTHPAVLQRVEKFGLGKPKRHQKRRPGRFQGLRFSARSRFFTTRVYSFFRNQTCGVRIFMTWISSAESFGGREVFALESLFRSHKDGCLVIVSSSLDSLLGRRIISPFLDKGYRVICVSPDFEYLFRNTHGESWFHKLINGKVRPGEVSLGQNLSNLLRLVLLYKFGGMYLDFDVIVLRSFTGLRNVIGAQTTDIKTGNWTRLNNAVLIFDRNHPLLFKFIQEFALTFDGNKWGHNGPYLVSRVVSRVIGKPGFDFSVLPPSAFYPVDWSRIGSLFHSPTGPLHSKWLNSKYGRILKESYGVHLWNKHSRNITIERGSIVDLLMSNFCSFCNNSASTL